MKKPRHSQWFIVKEFIFGALALVSIGLVITDLTIVLNNTAQQAIDRIDFAIACIFLLDFILGISFSKNRRHYLRRNWYYLLAAIPITDTITESLRGLRILRLVRLVRAGEHLGYSFGKDSGK